jgi:minor extracellular serine protease Vpr
MSAWKFVVKPVAVAVAALALAPALWAQSVPAADAENTQLWFIELAGRPVADGATAAAVQAEQDAFRAAAAQAGVSMVERRSFQSLFNGFSVVVSAAERAKLSRVAGVKALHPVEIIQAPTPETPGQSGADLAFALSLTGVNTVQNSLGLTGAGIKVGIIDSGIDIDHPAFGGSGTPGGTSFPTARVVAGYDFVGDAYNSGGTGNALIPVPDANPDDCGGHGTHVAGIVGGNGGGIRGVAPGVTFGAYRVFGCSGSTTSDIILAALERALADGMHVINQSLGAARQWPQYPTAQASSRLARKGVVMVASIGNNGPGGSSPDALWAAGAPGVGESVIGVASYDNAQRSFRVGTTPYGYNPATGSPLPPTIGSLPLARTGTPTSADDGCNAASMPPGSLAGQAVLIRRGTCSFYIKAFNAQAAGAAAVIIYNNQAGAINATVAGTPAITIPVVGTAAAQGVALDAVIAAGPATLNWSADAVAYPFGTGGLISGFSSFGMAVDLTVKPDVGAPGGAILSSYPLELGGAASLSGTSMSSPHTAGVAALVLQALPNAALGRDSGVVGRNPPPMINMATRLMNTAKPKNWSGNAALNLLDHSFRQGAGMVDAVAAIQSQQFVVPGKFSTGESAAGPTVQRLTIRNDALVPVTYTLGHVAGVAAGPNTQTGASYNITGVFDAPATVSFSAPTVVVPAKGTATVTVTVAANATLPDRALYGGYITLTPGADGTPINVYYAGFKGDYQSTRVLTPTASGYPWLAKLSGSTYTNQPSGASYSMAGSDTPFVLAHLDHHSRTLKLEALDAATSASRGVISEDQYVTRNSTPTGFFAFNWNGSTTAGVQPNGTYVIRVSVLKALGNPANAADWETWTSPTVTIARP